MNFFSPIHSHTNAASLSLKRGKPQHLTAWVTYKSLCPEQSRSTVFLQLGLVVVHELRAYTGAASPVSGAHAAISYSPRAQASLLILTPADPDPALGAPTHQPWSPQGAAVCRDPAVPTGPRQVPPRAAAAASSRWVPAGEGRGRRRQVRHTPQHAGAESQSEPCGGGSSSRGLAPAGVRRGGGGPLPAGVAPKTLTTGTFLAWASLKRDWPGSRPGSGLPM